MVTNIKEGKTKKCEQYWPDEVGRSQSYGLFNVTVVEQHVQSVLVTEGPHLYESTTYSRDHHDTNSSQNLLVV